MFSFQIGIYTNNNEDKVASVAKTWGKKDTTQQC